MDCKEKKQLQIIANEIRQGVITGVHSAKSGHPGGSLSITDILTYLYFKEMNVDPTNPKMADRDRFVLSKGHTAPALYSTLAEKGFFSKDLLKTLRKPDSILQGHPDMKKIPGVDMTTGSLGLGLSSACGMAIAGKKKGESYRVYCAVGDGEIEEGQIWEAAMFAAHYNLTNLCVIVDLNGLQIDGSTDEVMSSKPVDKKFEAFNFNVITIDGHDFDQIDDAFANARACTDKPTAILANTVKGKGVSYMENNVSWHGNPPNDEQYEQAMAELKAQRAELEA